LQARSAPVYAKCAGGAYNVAGALVYTASPSVYFGARDASLRAIVTVKWGNYRIVEMRCGR